jgi:DNA-directed RNA polymerase subunit beta'
MVLGLYYITKERSSTAEVKVKGEGMTFYSPEEVVIALNEGKIDLHAKIKVRITQGMEEGKTKIIGTTVGRVLFNQVVPQEVQFINELLTKKALRDIIGNIIKEVGMAESARFLDRIKDLGFMSAFKGGLSFSLNDVLIPKEKEPMIAAAQAQADEVRANFNMGFITNNERYNQIIDIWTHVNTRLTQTLMKQMTEDKQGFNSVYMMLDSGARGSKEQIRQLSGMRGLMAKPQKSGASTQDIIENPILSNFKEGLSILEYFISTHGARKGLADTALKTADAGYLTRRLVDVTQDVVINESDCGTLRGLQATALKKNEDTVESLYDRILGRTSVHDIIHPDSGDIIVASGDLITEDEAKAVESAGIDTVEIRSVLTCETKRGVCAKCYGRDLSTGRMVQRGLAAGVIAAQSIGEPGTQLTLRTFHVGGVAQHIISESRIISKSESNVEFDDLKTVPSSEGSHLVVIGRSGEMRLVNRETGVLVSTHNIPYGAKLYKGNGDKVKKDELICEWDPFNAVIVSEADGTIMFEDLDEGVTYRTESDEQTGFEEKVIIESRDKKKVPAIAVAANADGLIKSYSVPVGAHMAVADGQKVKAGDTLVKIPRVSGKSGDITGGLPRITELFEARNPSNPAVVSEVDGIVTYGKVKRGNREISIETRTGEVRKYLAPLSKHILVQENDFVKAGAPLSEGAITPNDILMIKGPTAVQEYIVNEVQEVYRLQGVKINDKHFEVIVRQMMRKVRIVDQGDTAFLERDLVNRYEFREQNDWIYGKMYVEESGDSESLKPGQIVSARKLRDENSMLKRKDLKLVVAREAVPATSEPVLQGITRASLQTESFISAASFQETTKVLNEAAVRGKIDELRGLKENVIVGHLIPAGTGLRDYDKLVVGSKEEYDLLMAAKLEEEAAI